MSPTKLKLAFAATLLSLPAPLFAQPTAAPPAAAAVQADPYEAAMAAILASADENVIIDNFVRAFAAELPKADSRLAALETEKPGLSLSIAEALRPAVKPYSQRVTTEFRGKVLLLMRDTFTPAEALTVAMIFSTPVMKKMMRIAVANYSQTNVLREAMRGDGTVSAGATAADNRAALNAALEELTPADYAELAKLPMNPELNRKMAQLNPKMNALRVEMENAQMLPAEERMIEEAVEAAMIKFLAGEK